jgi:hypothetical protein
VREWFREALGEPTPAQRQGWLSIQAGQNTLILAPTGSGKTLAAFLACLDALRANLVYPGWTDTPGERKYFSEEVLQRARAALPLSRLARPQQIARAVLFLVDPASEYITGITLSVDGKCVGRAKREPG